MNPARQKDRKTRKGKGKGMIIGSVCGVMIVVLVLILTGVIGGDRFRTAIRFAMHHGELTAGTDIAKEDITEFYYTRASSTYPPDYQRYHFHMTNGKYRFYHETREGTHWPLTEADITASGARELPEEVWAALLEHLQGGKVKKREVYTESGSSDPWLYLYWKGDGSLYQEFSFPSGEEEAAFEAFCILLRDSC